MNSTNKSGFCNSIFWDPAESWNTPNPDLSLCFEQTVLVWIPCLLLWVLAPFEGIKILSSKCRDVPWGFTNVSKLLLNLVLISISAVSLIMSTIQFSRGEDVFPVAFWTPAVQTITFTLAAVILVWDRVRGVHTSGGLFVFWLVLSIAGAAQLGTELREAGNKEDSSYSFMLYMIYYPSVVLMLVLNIFADPPPRVTDRPKTEKPCPAENASFASWCFFVWFEPLIWKGFRKPLTLEDLWNLRYHDTSAYVVTKFEKIWNKVLKPNTRFLKMDKYNKMDGSLKNKSNRPKKPVSILGTMVKTYWMTIFNSALLKLLADVFSLCNPHLLYLMIKFVESKDYVWKGVLYAVGMLLASQLHTICTQHYANLMYETGVNWRTALTSAIYKKVLRISSSARKTRSFGEIVNLMAVDAHRLVDTAPFLHAFWSLPLLIITCLYFLWQILGVATLAGVAVLVVLLPINVVVSKRVRTLQLRQFKHKDERVKFIGEVLNGIKVLKMYAWEPSFKTLIRNIRNQELSLLRTAAMLNASTSLLTLCSSFLVSLASFTVFVLIDERNVLTPDTAFVAMAYFNIMRLPLAYIPTTVDFVMQFFVATQRISKFMNADELDLTSVSHDMSRKETLVIEDGTFSWGTDKDDKPILRNITLTVQPGQLVAVVGPIGAGKSSLLSAFLGEMDKNSGYVTTKGKTAYVSQQAWIQNASVRENILFGHSFNEKKYNDTIKNCALTPDLQMLSGGDATEIGEKGINLSGGQKQRISLARAVYSDADVYLLDDPLSAVDSHVGKHIFDNVIGPKSQLHKKTRILVTHGIAFLPQVDVILVMKEGEILERGTFKELLDKRGEFSEFLVQHLAETDQHELIPEIEELVDKEIIQTIQRRMSKSESVKSISFSVSKGTSLRNLSTTKQNEGEIKLEENNEDVEERMLDRGMEMKLIDNRKTRDLFTITQNNNDSETKALLENSQPKGKAGSTVSISSVNRKSANQSDIQQTTKLVQLEAAETGRVRRSVYLHYCKFMGVWLVIGTVGLSLLSQAASILANIRLAQWTSDQSASVNGTQILDKRNFYLQMYFTFGFIQVVTVVASTFMLAIGTVLAAGHLHESIVSNILHCPMTFFDTTPMGRIVNRLGKDIDVVDNVLPNSIRMVQNSLSTVFGTIVVIIWSTPLFALAFVPIGLVYYYVQKIFVTTSGQLKRIESVTRSPIYSHFSETLSGASSIRAYKVEKRFINTLQEMVDTNQVCLFPSMISNRWLALRLETLANILIFIAALFAVLGRDSLDPGIVGLSISYALQITFVMNMAVRMFSEVESSIVSVERIKEYANLPQEAAWVTKCRPSPQWPTHGVIKFQDYLVRYRPGLDLVLNGISFTVLENEKIGIVGRTGAGKSSLTLCLFRIIEAAGGHIYIDDIDISKIGLGDLRSKLTIVPQDPVLFSGHLRMNLDPFDMYSDADIWWALEHAHLHEYVKSLPAGLKHPVSEGGENLSVGQRQLICLARALLRKTKVMILDEATAAIDLDTDDLIQQTIRKEFSDCTVLTIAHRLNTIMDSDRVMVLHNGLIAEFDSPKNLLKSPSSMFYSLAKDSGLV